MGYSYNWLKETFEDMYNDGLGNNVYTVVKGDKLWNISKAALEKGPYYLKYPMLDNETIQNFVNLLADKNNIPDKNTIYIGQKIVLFSSTHKPKNNGGSTNPKPTINHFGVKADTEKTLYATWLFDWPSAEVENYEIEWMYHNGTDPVWYVGESSTVETAHKQSVWQYDKSAKKVKFRVKAISKTHTVNDKEKKYFTETWSNYKTYYVEEEPPEVPSSPTVSIEGNVLKWSLDNIDAKTEEIGWQIVKNNKSIVAEGQEDGKRVEVITAHAEGTYTIPASDASSLYKVRCRGYKLSNNDKIISSEWSEYSDNISARPATPKEITECRAVSETQVYIKWSSVSGATAYEIEYANDVKYFDSNSGTSVFTIEKNAEGILNTYTNMHLETGLEYFFRVRAVNDTGASKWTGYKSVLLGEKPTSPTTWSSVTVTKVGEDVTVFWTHNPKDESYQTQVQIELVVDGGEPIYIDPLVGITDDEKRNETGSYTIDTTAYASGAVLTWRVRTAGVTGKGKTWPSNSGALDWASDWSMQRIINVYADLLINAKLSTNEDDANNKESWDTIRNITALPLYITARIDTPGNQSVIGYHVSIRAKNNYETVDNTGEIKYVIAGEEIYSRFFDVKEDLIASISAQDISFENNQEYDVTCMASLDSGLSSSKTISLSVTLADFITVPSAAIYIDRDRGVIAEISPMCANNLGSLSENTSLSVYRREFDGSFTEIATDIANTGKMTVIDPHPALDYARYRIVATNILTGQVVYYDMPGYPVNEKAAIIQWDETWRPKEVPEVADAMEENLWTGSVLKLKYNIDVSEQTSQDVALINYAGRKRPVSYYGTQIGETQSWSVAIPKSDTETLFALRRLSAWMGDVYVREPSGTGYWANIQVSFEQKHKDVTIPVTIDITRVEGGA